MAKVVTFDVEARQHLKKGIDTVAQSVRITLGPKGRNVVLEKKFGAPTVTNDGVTIVREIELKDAMENTGAQLLREVATKTNDVAGDGTTTPSPPSSSSSRGCNSTAATSPPTWSPTQTAWKRCWTTPTCSSPTARSQPSRTCSPCWSA